MMNAERIGMRNSLSRRDAITYGGSALLGSLVAGSTVNAAQAETLVKTKNLIFVWGEGGGPALPDFSDPTNFSPNIDVLFQAVETNLPGLHLAEPFGKLGSVADKMLFFQNRVSHDLNHPTAIGDTLRRKADRTHYLSDLAMRSSGKPFGYIEPPHVLNGFDYRNISFSVPLSTEAPWSKVSQEFILPDVSANTERLETRRALLQTLERKDPTFGDASTDRWSQVYDAAMDVVARNQKVLRRLDPRDVSRYSNGEEPTPGTLLPLVAREMIRRKIASVVLIRAGYHTKSYGSGGFDIHGQARSNMLDIAPPMAHSVTELIQDCESGLLPDTVIVFDTEFGRTPRLTGITQGREHWPYHPSFVYGGNFQRGRVIGSLDNFGEPIDAPIDNPTFASLVLQGVSETPDRKVQAGLPRNIFQ